MSEIETTWATHELPILAAALRYLDRGEQPELREIHEDTGLEPMQLIAGVHALEDADPPYLELELFSGWSEERVGGGYIASVSERARRQLG